MGKIVLPEQELWPRESAPGILGKPEAGGPQGSTSEQDVQVGYTNAFTEDEKGEIKILPQRRMHPSLPSSESMGTWSQGGELPLL